MIQVEPVAAAQMGPELQTAWSEWQAGQSRFSSPLFRPELVQAVASVRPNIEVALIRDAKGPAGFFPYARFQRAARPFAGCLTGIEGVVTRPDFRLSEADAEVICKGCNLTSVTFNNLLADQPAFARHHATADDYPYMDLSCGFEAYRAERKAAKSDELATALRKTRKFEREVGELQFDASCQDLGSLSTLLHWKAAQLRNRRLVNHLDESWVSALFQRLITDEPREHFRAMFSTLHVGDTLIAASMGIRSANALHGWVTAYNSEYHKYSPGLLLVAKIAQRAESLGIERIELGRGSEPYKRSFRSGGFQVAQGAVQTGRLNGAAKNALYRSQAWLKNSSLGGTASRVAQSVRWAVHNVQKNSLKT